MVGIQVWFGDGNLGSGPYPGACSADSLWGTITLQVTRTTAAFTELDMRAPLGMANGNAGLRAMFRARKWHGTNSRVGDGSPSRRANTARMIATQGPTEVQTCASLRFRTLGSCRCRPGLER